MKHILIQIVFLLLFLQLLQKQTDYIIVEYDDVIVLSNKDANINILRIGTPNIQSTSNNSYLLNNYIGLVLLIIKSKKHSV